MKLLYGLSSSLADSYENAVIETIKFAIQNDFKVVEIFCETPDVLPDEISDGKIREIRELANSYNLRIQLHAPFHSLNLSSFNPKIKNVSMKIIRDTISLAYKLESSLVTLHLGLCFLPCQLDRKKALTILADSITDLLKFAKNYNITLAIENRGGRLDLGRLEDLLFILETVSHENLGITFDVVQANAVGDPLIYYESLKGNIVNMHISDSPRGKSLLLAVGEGEINYRELVRRIIKDNINVPLIFEVSNKDKAIQSRAVLEGYFKEIKSD